MKLYTLCSSGSQPGIHGPIGGPRTAVRGPQDLKICITDNGRGSTGCLIFAIGGSRLKKVGIAGVVYCTSRAFQFTLLCNFSKQGIKGSRTD